MFIQTLRNEANVACASVIGSSLSGGNSNLSQILAIPGCPDLYKQFLSSCHTLFGENMVS